MVANDIAALNIRQRSQCFDFIEVLLKGLHDLDGVDAAIHLMPASLNNPEAASSQGAQLLIVALEPTVLFVVILHAILDLLVGVSNLTVVVDMRGFLRWGGEQLLAFRRNVLFLHLLNL